METFDRLPLEVQEQIFSNLTPQDIKKCSTVSSKWHEILNSNQIWLRMCAFEGLTGKKFLDDDFSLIQNPTKQFSNEVTMIPVGHWKSHYQRYKYVKRNWRIGYFVKAPIRFTPVHINEKFVIQHVNDELVIWDVCGKLKKFCSIPLAVPNSNINDFLWKGDYLLYIQERLIVCLKRGESNCKEVLRIPLEVRNCSQVRNSCLKQNLTVRLTEKFILIQDHYNPCVLTFYDCNKGTLARKVDLHKTLGNTSLYFNSLDIIDDKVFVAYRSAGSPYFMKYSYNHDTWETPITLAALSEVVNLYLNKKYVCIKLGPESRESTVSFFQVWDHSLTFCPLDDVTQFFATKHLPIVLTDDDYVIFHQRDEIKVQSLITGNLLTLSGSRNVMNFVPVWDRYLVVLDDKGVTVWDWTIEKKINTPFRNNFCSTIYASETNIVVRTEDEQFFLISYW